VWLCGISNYPLPGISYALLSFYLLGGGAK